jgi:hypothetical protein
VVRSGIQYVLLLLQLGNVSASSAPCPVCGVYKAVPHCSTTAGWRHCKQVLVQPIKLLLVQVMALKNSRSVPCQRTNGSFAANQQERFICCAWTSVTAVHQDITYTVGGWQSD